MTMNSYKASDGEQVRPRKWIDQNKNENIDTIYLDIDDTNLTEMAMIEQLSETPCMKRIEKKTSEQEVSQ